MKPSDDNDVTWVNDSVDVIIDWKRFSQYKRLINVVAYCLRWKSKQRGQIAVTEIEQAETVVLILTQRERFDDLYGKLTLNTARTLEHDLARLCPFVDEQDTIRLKGQLNKSTLSVEMKHPVLLSSKHDTVMLMLRQAHIDNHHEGTEFNRSTIQQKYWVLGLRNALRSIKAQCVQCGKLTVKPMHPQMADLPKERLEIDVAPFRNTGMDYFDPFDVSMFRKTVKYCCCLFTCLVTRAVHIEVVNGLDTDACMMAITRFMARRGKPRTIISDNGTNFAGAARELKKYAQLWVQELIWRSRESYGNSILLEHRILKESGSEWCVAARSR